MRGAKAIGENRAGRQALEQRPRPAVAAPRGQCGTGLHDPGGKAAREEQDFRCGRRDARVTTPGAARTACSFGPDLRWGSPLDGRIEIAEERVEGAGGARFVDGAPRSEEHTSELQSRPHLVCRLLLEKKKKTKKQYNKSVKNNKHTAIMYNYTLLSYIKTY